MSDNKYLPIIGLEIHVALKTNSKMFCGCKNDPFHAAAPNIYTCPVCLGMPGALPVPNRKAVDWTIRLGLALNCEIASESKFDRKNYFYPDLPKGYQISQYDQPIARSGYLVISYEVRNPGSEAAVNEVRFARSLANARDDRKEGKKKIRIHRVHLEEDTGKLLHQTVNGKKVTLIDFNRCGVPLVEIVTEPDIHSAQEAKLFLKQLYLIIRYLEISDADMEKGSMRLEPNISVAPVILSETKELTKMRGRPFGRDAAAAPENDKIPLPNYKVEVKNINSFKFVGKAIEYEVARQIEILNREEIPIQETRGWEEKKGVTISQRRKEAAHDYRYFPEPDIPPMHFAQNQILNINNQIGELPEAKLVRFINDYGLPVQDAQRLIGEREMAEYFEKNVKCQRSNVKYQEITPKIIVNWILNKKVDIHKVPPDVLLKSISSAKIGLSVDEKEIQRIIEKVIANNTKAVADYKSGKTGAIMFLIGMVMKEINSNAGATTVRKLLEKELE